MHRGDGIPRKPPIMMNVHNVRVRMFWRFFSGLSDCTGVAVAAGCGTNCGGGMTMIVGCCAEGVGCVAGRSSLASPLLSSGTGGAAVGSGPGSVSRASSVAGGSECQVLPFAITGWTVSGRGVSSTERLSVSESSRGCSSVPRGGEWLGCDEVAEASRRSFASARSCCFFSRRAARAAFLRAVLEGFCGSVLGEISGEQTT